MEFLLLGLLVGMAHAFEADHMAAIGTLASGGKATPRRLALAAAATQNAVTALIYILVFGAGSILGMAALTYAASWPLRLAEKTASRLLKTVQMATGVAAVAVGVIVMTEAAPVIWGAV